ncbi:MAG: dienelactone hydrolase family protein [Erythrobacter sp.]|uniref:dienelactone hydrolase family protein n=1 Tax=Erythrobacter sp. TaxID=1042 RepID=UPI003266194A
MAMERFLEREIVFANGAIGEAIEFESAGPANFHDILNGADVPKITIDGKLFLPPDHDGSPLPCVIVVPGSVGVAESHLMHTETLCAAGYAAFIVDPFGARSVAVTYDDQTQFSFAASAYDVLAAVKTMAARPEVDASRIGVQGHSRGGAAVVQAAMKAMQRTVLGEGEAIKTVYGVYPWAGQQFLNPDIGDVTMRIVIGEQDEWCSPQQAQGYAQAIRLASSGDLTFKMYEGAHHSYDRQQGMETFPTATVAPRAPTVYIDDAGAFIDPITGTANPAGTDRDFLVYAAKAGFMVTGAQLGSSGTLADQFREDMLGFWESSL